MWRRVADRLTASGLVPTTVELPLTGLDDDVAAVTSAIDTAPEPVLVCGHAYGGAVVTHALARGRPVAALAYICGFVPGLRPVPPGRPCLGTTAKHWVDETGQVTMSPELAIDTLFNRCEPALATWAAGRLRPAVMVPAELYTAASRPHPIDARPSAYAVCTADQAMHPDDQREIAARANHRVEWPLDHSPMLSGPDLVADWLLELATVLPVEA